MSVEKVLEEALSFSTRGSNCPICKRSFRDCQHTITEVDQHFARLVFVARLQEVEKRSEARAEAAVSALGRTRLRRMIQAARSLFSYRLSWSMKEHVSWEMRKRDERAVRKLGRYIERWEAELAMMRRQR